MTRQFIIIKVQPLKKKKEKVKESKQLNGLNQPLFLFSRED